MAGRFHAKRVWLLIAVFTASLVLTHWNSAAARVRGDGVAAGLALGLIIGGMAASQDKGGAAGGKTYRSCSSVMGPGAVNSRSNPARCVCRSGYAWSSEGGRLHCVARGNTGPTVTRSVNAGKGTHSAAELEKIQEALNLLNYDAGEVDGAMGQKTQRAILKFQADKRFPQTGYLPPGEQQTLFADVEHKRALEARNTLKGPDTSSASVDDTKQTDARMELAHWETVKNTKVPAELEDYIARFPNGAFTKLASLRLEQLRAQDEEQRGKRRPEPKKNADGKVVQLPPIDDTVFPRARQRRPDAVAVIIGNGSYRNSVPAVEFSGRDADAMKLVAVKTLGLDSSNILFLKDATRGQMDEVFGTDKDYKGKLWRTIDPDGRSDVYIFYSGHGVPGTNEVEGTFLLPIDGDPSHASLNGYPLKQLYKNLSELKTKSVTVFLDACFSGQAADPSGTPLIKNASPVFIAKATTPGDGIKINVFAAASERQLSSWDPEAGHGIFTRYVLSGLAGDADTDKNRDITAKELREYVTRHVRKAARRMHGRDQEPSFAGDDNFVLSSF